MEWKAVDSSQISEVGYDVETSTLGIRFKSWKADKPQSEYHYIDVPQDVHAAMLTAKSVGKYFTENIKPFADKYPFTKVA